MVDVDALSEVKVARAAKSGVKDESLANFKSCNHPIKAPESQRDL